MRSAAVVALLLVAAPAAAERRTNGLSEVACRDCKHDKADGDLVLDASFGLGRTWSDVPMRDARTSGDLAVSFGAYGSFALRGHAQLGTGPTTLTTIGLELRREHHRLNELDLRELRRIPIYFVAIGPAFGRMRDRSDGVDALVAAMDGRAGIVYRGVHVSFDLMPGHALANDSIATSADLGWFVRAGISAGIDY